MLKSSIFEIHLTNSRSFKRRNVVRNVHLFTGSNTLKYARVSLRGDRLSGKSSNKNRENYPRGADRNGKNGG